MQAAIKTLTVQGLRLNKATGINNVLNQYFIYVPKRQVRKTHINQ